MSSSSFDLIAATCSSVSPLGQHQWQVEFTDHMGKIGATVQIDLIEEVDEGDEIEEY